MAANGVKKKKIYVNVRKKWVGHCSNLVLTYVAKCVALDLINGVD